MNRQIAVRANVRQSSAAVTSLLILVPMCLLYIGLGSPDFALLAIAAASFVMGVMLLWRPGETPVLLVVFLFQWLQASMPVLKAAFDGVALDAIYDRPGAYSDAAVLSHLALVCMAIGMRLGVGRRPISAGPVLQEGFYDRSVADWFRLYLMFFVIAAAAQVAARAAPGLSQVLLGFDDLRWAFYILLAGACFAQGRGFIFLAAAFLAELGLGFSGYFSDFKTVFVMSLIALVLSGAKIDVRWGLMALILGGAALYLGLLWTAVKPEYRAFVSGGERAQIIVVGYGERLQKLGELAASVDEEGYRLATEDLVNRIGYLEFFGGTIAHVPAVVPHEEGRLLADAVLRPFTPRALFPDKPVIDDSIRTRTYTGWFVSGSETGTSISIGWIGEMYIDFGRWLMMAAAVGIGLFYGGIQRLLTGWRYSKGLGGAAAASAMLIAVMFLETSITKATGGLVASLITVILAFRFMIPLIAPRLVARA